MGYLSEVIEGTVTKSNDLIEASYKLTLNEQRLILSAISTIDPDEPLPKVLTFTAKTFAEVFNLSDNKAYEALSEAADRLFDRDIKTYDGRNEERIRWVSRVKYMKGEGTVSVSFTEWVAPYLTKLNSRFTSYKLKNIGSLRSVYAIRLYEMVMQYKDEHGFTIGVNELRERFEIQKKYERFSNLRARVINPALKELKDNSGLVINFKPFKEGRNITHLKFSYTLPD
ncbi:MAG: replication initiation protein [Gammaproteobacteria bacterium]|nr:replication initiation protein [Gammaproteobacteria bacterium]